VLLFFDQKNNNKRPVKNFYCIFILMALTCITDKALAQNIAINTTGLSPDASSLLDINASPGNNMGVLIPRIALTATNIALPIAAPALSLLIYNTATSGSFPNSVLPGFYYWNGAVWVAFETKEDRYSSVDAGASITTSSTVDQLVGGMSITPAAGTYTVNFNGQCDIPDAVFTTGFASSIAKADLDLIYNDLAALTVTDLTHILSFGGGETLTAGVYDVVGAMSITGALTLDGQGDPNALFVIRGTAAFNTSAGATVTLINGASANNVFWVAQDAVGLGASTVIQGTIFSNTAAIAVGSNCTVTGSLFTKGGAIAFGPGTLSIPLNPSFINLRSLASFVIFTGGGGVANTGASTYTGDIGTDLGAITSFSAAGCVVNGTIYQPGSTTLVVPIYHEAIFSLYSNGVLIPNSERSILNSSVIDLRGIAKITAGQTIEVRWRMDTQTSDNGAIGVSNRILSITKVD
jgi:hypothetical protein